MKHKRCLLLLLLTLWLAPIGAQSITITRAFQLMPNASVMTIYKNQFAKWWVGNPDDTFPYVLIRIGLDGNEQEVQNAKNLLTLDLGPRHEVATVFKEVSNELLFLIPVAAPFVKLDYGDISQRKTLLDASVGFKSNTIYYGRVHLSMDKKEPSNLPKQQYPFTLSVEPASAHVEVTVDGAIQEWELTNGQAQQTLAEGSYSYSITANNYRTNEGVLIVDALHTDTLIALTPRFGWISLIGDSSDLTGLTVEMERYKQVKIMPLPIDSMQCGIGAYNFEIIKPKHHKWKHKTVVHPGEHVKISPILQPKVYKSNTFILLEGGYAINPSWGVGLMAGQVYGEVTRVCGIGWYVKGRSNFQTTQAVESAQIQLGGVVGETMPSYTGEKRNTEWIANVGAIINFFNKTSVFGNRNMLGVYAGLGYGQYTRYWQVLDGRWIEYAPTSVSGLSFGAGAIGSINGLTISAGVNSIMAKYMEIEVGIGWMF